MVFDHCCVYLDENLRGNLLFFSPECVNVLTNYAACSLAGGFCLGRLGWNETEKVFSLEAPVEPLPIAFCFLYLVRWVIFAHKALFPYDKFPAGQFFRVKPFGMRMDGKSVFASGSCHYEMAVGLRKFAKGGRGENRRDHTSLSLEGTIRRTA